jgi:hypothetical protein
MTRQVIPGPGSAPGPFLSVRCWRSHTGLQVGTREAFSRLGLQAIAVPCPLLPQQVSDKNDCTV